MQENTKEITDSRKEDDVEPISQRHVTNLA